MDGCLVVLILSMGDGWQEIKLLDNFVYCFLRWQKDFKFNLGRYCYTLFAGGWNVRSANKMIAIIDMDNNIN